MAITTNVRINQNANDGIPNTYVPATLPAISGTIKGQSKTNIDCSLVENATEATALSNLTTELQTYLTNTFFDDVLHLDAADTITVNVTVTKIERTRTEANDLKPGTEVYAVSFNYEYSY